MKSILLQYKNVYNIVIIKSNSKYMIGKMKCENIWNTRSSEESKVSSCYNYLFPVTGQCFWKLSKEAEASYWPFNKYLSIQTHLLNSRSVSMTKCSYFLLVVTINNLTNYFIYTSPSYCVIIQLSSRSALFYRTTFCLSNLTFACYHVRQNAYVFIYSSIKFKPQFIEIFWTLHCKYNSY